MIKNFENITTTLSSSELKVSEILVDAFKGMEKGKENAKTSSKIREALKTKMDIILEDVRLRRIINYIRQNDLVLGLCTTSSGYFMAANAKEFHDTLTSLNERIKSQTYTLQHMILQYNKMYNYTAQTTQATQTTKLI